MLAEKSATNGVVVNNQTKGAESDVDTDIDRDIFYIKNAAEVKISTRTGFS